MCNWSGAGAPACGVNGSEYPSAPSTRFPSAISLDQTSHSELPLINYVQSHMLGSRSWLLFLTPFTFKIMVFYLTFKYVLKHCYLSGEGTHLTNQAGSCLSICDLWFQPLSYWHWAQISPGRLCPVFGYCIWLWVKKKKVLTINLHRGKKRLCKILKSLPLWGERGGGGHGSLSLQNWKSQCWSSVPASVTIRIEKWQESDVATAVWLQGPVECAMQKGNRERGCREMEWDAEHSFKSHTLGFWHPERQSYIFLKGWHLSLQCPFKLLLWLPWWQKETVQSPMWHSNRAGRRLTLKMKSQWPFFLSRLKLL